MARFEKGVSGNPKGRAVAAGPRREQRRRRRTELKAIEAARNKLTSRLDHVLEVVETYALSGDMIAAGHWLNFAMPRPRPESPRLEIPGLDADAETASAAVMAALSRGAISCEQGETLLRILEARARLSFSAQTVQKLARLKELLRARGAPQLADTLSLPIVRQFAEGAS